MSLEKDRKLDLSTKKNLKQSVTLSIHIITFKVGKKCKDDLRKCIIDSVKNYRLKFATF